MKILLVEDHLGLAKISCSVLQEMYGHEVRHAGSGEAALAVLPEFHPDLALVDLNLPGITGYDLAQQIRDRPGYETTVLVALTGYGSLLDDVAVRTAGFDALFSKPMDFDLLPTVKRRLG